MTRPERDALLLHVIVGTGAGALLAAPVPLETGWRLALVVGAYLVAVPAVGGSRGHRGWLHAWGLALPLGVLLVLPQWVLVAELGIVAPAADGFPDIGPVTGYAPGLWAAALFAVLLAGEAAGTRQGWLPAYAVVLLLSLLLLGGIEAAAAQLPLWRPRGVAVVAGGAALHGVVAAVLLGVATYATHVRLRGRRWLVRACATVPLMLFYLGAQVGSWFVLDRLPALL